MHTRLASYNIRKCLGTDRKRRPERTLDVINALAADVVALQEVDRRYQPRPFALDPGLIARESDFAPVECATNPESLGWHGQTVLLRRGLRAARVSRLELPALEPRGALAVDVEDEDGRGPMFRVVAVHLGLVRHWRRRQLAAIRAALAEAPALPTAIMGDFNEWSTGQGMEPLTGRAGGLLVHHAARGPDGPRPAGRRHAALRGLDLAPGPDAFRIHAPGRSYPTLQPLGRLDRVAVNAGMHLIDAGVLDTPLARVASDHLPIWADVRPEAAPRAAPLARAPAAPGPGPA